MFGVAGRRDHIVQGDALSLTECFTTEISVCDGETCRVGSQANGAGSRLSKVRGIGCLNDRRRDTDVHSHALFSFRSLFPRQVKPIVFLSVSNE